MQITVFYDFYAAYWRSRGDLYIVVEVESSATINDVQTKVRGLLGFGEKIDCWTIVKGDYVLGGKTLAECDVRDGSVLDLMIERGDDVMEIFVLTQAGERIRRIVASSGTVACVKSLLQNELEAADPRVDGQCQCLFFNGKELEDDRTLKQYGIEPESCLLVVTGRKPKPERPNKMYSLEVNKSDTMDIVQAKIQYKIGILSDQHKLYAVGSDETIARVEDGRILASFDCFQFQTFLLCDPEDEGSSMVKFHVRSFLGETYGLEVEILPTLDPDLKIKMLKERIKWMIFQFMEQRRGWGGIVDEGGSKTFSSGSLDFRDNYIAIVLFDGSYIWIKSRDPAHKGVRIRSRVNRPDKYEPRFKPPVERTLLGETLKFNHLSVGEYDTLEKATAVWKMAAFYYDKHDGRLELADGTHFCVPPMSQALSGIEKANWVKAKVKKVREEYWKRLKASKNRPLVTPEGSSWDVAEEIMAALDEPLSADQPTSSSEDRSDDDVAHGRTELPASSPSTVASEDSFITSQGNMIQQLSRQLTEQQHINRQLSEQLRQSRENEQRLKEGNAELQQKNEELESVIKQTSSIYADFYLRSIQL